MREIPGRRVLHEAARIQFREELRDARLRALRDAEDFHELLFTFERLGSFILKELADLGTYAAPLGDVAGISPLARTIPDAWPQFHTRFGKLFDFVRDGRNAALHQGMFARCLTRHAMEAATILEHALMSEANKIGQYMVRTPTCACLWHPVSFVRQTMLLSSFSYLPVRLDGDDEQPWKVVSDTAVARYLHDVKSSKEVQTRLASTLGEAVNANSIILEEPLLCRVDDSVHKVLKDYSGVPRLVVDHKTKELIGIVMPFDLL